MAEPQTETPLQALDNLRLHEAALSWKEDSEIKRGTAAADIKEFVETAVSQNQGQGRLPADREADIKAIGGQKLVDAFNNAIAHGDDINQAGLAAKALLHAIDSLPPRQSQPPQNVAPASHIQHITAADCTQPVNAPHTPAVIKAKTLEI